MDERVSRRRAVIGVMTGTSLDGVDVVAAAIDGTGLTMQARVVRHVACGLGSLADDLRRAAAQEPMTAGGFAALGLRLGERYVEAIAEAAGVGERTDLIAVHGQTVFHCPPVSWQLINPAPIAARFLCPVVFDLRQADLAAGGQGAPITPIADWVLFRVADRRRAIVNLGGVGNVTVLPPADDTHAGLDAVEGFDVCACNQVLDAVARQTLGTPYDEGGRAAARGSPDPDAATALVEILSDQRRRRRSLGSDREPIEWVGRQRLSPEDLAASAVDAVGRCLGEALAGHEIDEVIVAGGGARNDALVKTLASRAAAPVRLSDELGVAAEAREALAMAVLGALCADQVPITLPRVTGTRRPAALAGVWCLTR